MRYYPSMAFSLYYGPPRDALISAARNQSPENELRCLALLGLMQICQPLRQALFRPVGQNILTESGYCMIACLSRRELLSTDLPQLAREFSLSPSAVSLILGRLEISGLIQRDRATKNRGISVIRATPAGERAFANTHAHYLQSITRVMSVLDSRDLTTVDHACARLRRAASSHIPVS